MKIINQNLTIRDYRDAIRRGEIIINRHYQRSDQVWPEMAKSYLMETIILDFPVPKLYLHQTQDLKTRKPIKHIVDGQQRTQAIMDFCDDKFALSRKLETESLRGQTFSQLDEEVSEAFLNYGLSMDLFTAAPIDQVIEVFRRMNSYTVPLNPEEKRHAGFQGLFKWYISRLAKSLQPSFREIGAFSEKQIFRMADAKLLTETSHAILHGIETTNARKLDALYRSNDKKFDEEKELTDALKKAVGEITGWVELHEGLLMKPYQLYSLILATAHIRCRIQSMQALFRVQRARAIDRVEAVTALSTLADAVEREDDDDYEEFVLASTSKTNVKAHRETRFTWFCRALTGRDD
jgi:hypothetical protein